MTVLKTIWEWLKKVPGWVWGALWIITTYITLQRHLLSERQATISRKRRVLEKKHRDINADISKEQDAAKNDAEKKHAETELEIAKEDRRIWKASKSISSITNKVNRVFGGDSEK
jgi:hypothetical protein